MIGKTFLHFCCWLEPRFLRGDFRWRHRRQQSARADGVHRAMMQMLLGPQKMNVVRYYERHAEFAAEAFRFAQHASISRREVLHLDVEAVAENLLELRKVIRDW